MFLIDIRYETQRMCGKAALENVGALESIVIFMQWSLFPIAIRLKNVQ